MLMHGYSSFQIFLMLFFKYMTITIPISHIMSYNVAYISECLTITKQNRNLYVVIACQGLRNTDSNS